MTEETTVRFDDEKAFRAAIKRTITWFHDKRIRLASPNTRSGLLFANEHQT